ncbi:MAG: hypothetical protein AB7F40_10855 [Victivallaceae bacterium]|nr:RDD family protein [Victivallaceae bacterium]
MEYLYKDAEGCEQGPIGVRRVIELIDDGVITTDTPLRKTTIGSWNPAGSHRAFQELFDPLCAPVEKNLPKMLHSDGSHYETTAARKIAEMMDSSEAEPARNAMLNWVVYRHRIHAGLIDLFIHLVALAVIAAGVLQWNWDTGSVWEWNGGNSFSEAKSRKAPGDLYTLWKGGVSCYSRPYRDTTGNVVSRYWLDVADPENRVHILFDLQPLAIIAAKFFAGYLALYALIGLAIKQQTLGMGTVNLHLLDNYGRRASQSRSLLFAILWLLIGIFYPLTALFTNGLGLHSKLSGTQVK